MFFQFFDDPSSVPSEEDYNLLRFYDSCTRYAKTIRKNATLLSEWYAFKHGPEMKEVLAEVVADNNLQNMNITLDDLEDFYKMSSHETAVQQADEEISGWLKLFRPEHLYVLEYLHDMKVGLVFRSLNLKARYLQKTPFPFQSCST
ncbi:unnamed protein product [Dibothriocephalus latus]|uniref:Uncharacterized protein n=1 Tax=Dibothriocephalus latus TaxID=60516 RepID=A0A3P7MJ13_DIBLA|nr:unnamed protein product [Dibothriocephalus latus]